jgi:hypothetical protein
MTKPRKGEKYIPELAVLLRDAQPTWREIEGEPDLRKQQSNKRDRELAIDELVTIYNDHEKQARLCELPADVRMFCRRLKQQNGGKLPRRKGGRPVDLHRRLQIAMGVVDAIEGKEGAPKGVEQAIAFVASKFMVVARTVRDIHYDRDPDWMVEVEAELARRRYEAGVG